MCRKYKQLIIFLLFSLITVNVLADTATNVTDQIVQTMSSITPAKRSAVEERMKQENLISTNQYGLAFYKPTYILPAYYTASPYDKVYEGQTPENQKPTRAEFKTQFSFKFSLFPDLLGKNSFINFAYTQLMYWQLYTKSPYFRETDYEPEIFISKQIIHNWWVNLGAEHQSNGRGGDMERSWNRVYLNIMFSNANWMISVKPWLLIFQHESSSIHNPDITKYMGHGEIILAYKVRHNTFSLMLRNQFFSGFKRGALELDWSFPIYKMIKGYAQFFSGYGQSLIEYDHYTNSVGIGISLSDLI